MRIDFERPLVFITTGVIFAAIFAPLIIVGVTRWAEHTFDARNTPKPTPPGTLHVYLATQTGLTYICQTKQTASQVITCVSGETVLLTEQLHKQIVLTTAKLQ